MQYAVAYTISDHFAWLDILFRDSNPPTWHPVTRRIYCVRLGLVPWVVAQYVARCPYVRVIFIVHSSNDPDHGFFIIDQKILFWCWSCDASNSPHIITSTMHMRRRESVISAETETRDWPTLFFGWDRNITNQSHVISRPGTLSQSDVNGGGLGLNLPLPDNFLTPSLGTPYSVQKFYEINLLLRFAGYFFSPYSPRSFVIQDLRCHHTSRIQVTKQLVALDFPSSSIFPFRTISSLKKNGWISLWWNHTGKLSKIEIQDRKT